MYFTGFADEASGNIEGQIAATKKLNWQFIESRNINGCNLHNLPDDEFEKVAEKLEESGIKINCIGSEIANWGRDPLSNSDFATCIEMMQRTLKRMNRLNCSMLRGMSFKILLDRDPFAMDIEREVFRKVNYLVQMCEEAGVIYGHENCMNYGGQSYVHTLKLLEKIKSPFFKLIFDTGNPLFSDLRLGDRPYKKQSSWDFYRNVREFIHYVHIKDGRFVCNTNSTFPEVEYTFANEGNGEVKRIVKDLLANGYDGGFSMEPHMSKVYHDAEGKYDPEKAFNNYVEYGQKFMAVVKEAQAELQAEKTGKSI